MFVCEAAAFGGSRAPLVAQAEAEHRARARRGMYAGRRGNSSEIDRGGGLRVGRVDADGLHGGQGANGTLGLGAIAYAVGALHAEEVVSAGHEGVRHLRFAAH